MQNGNNVLILAGLLVACVGLLVFCLYMVRRSWRNLRYIKVLRRLILKGEPLSLVLLPTVLPIYADDVNESKIAARKLVKTLTGLDMGLEDMSDAELTVFCVLAEKASQDEEFVKGLVQEAKDWAKNRGIEV